MGKQKKTKAPQQQNVGSSSTSSSTGRIRQKATKHRQTVQIERFERFFVCIWLTEKTGKRQIKSVYISQFVPPNKKSH